MKWLRTSSMLLALSVAFAAHAADTCKGGPKSEWKRPDAAKKAAMQQGYNNIVKVIIEDGCYEVVTLNKEGKIVGVQFDPVTLKLMKVEDAR